jgi:hypothetical protein
MQAALHGADGDGVGDQERFEPGLDGEEAADTLEHGHG